MNTSGLGKLITGDAQRDAIHIAIAPVIAGERLYPGQPVFVRDGRATSRGIDRSGYAIGIVDPFLIGPVYPDQRFWLFVQPGITTPIRHHWTHPAFRDEMIVNEITEDKRYKGEMTKENCHEWCEEFDESGNPL